MPEEVFLDIKERSRQLEKQPDGTTPSTTDQPSGNTGFSFPSTHFVDREKQPIDEVLIRGNQRVGGSEIREALEKGPDDIGNAIKTMKAILPHFIGQGGKDTNNPRTNAEHRFEIRFR